jgi:hypothetical protein
MSCQKNACQNKAQCGCSFGVPTMGDRAAATDLAMAATMGLP